MPWLPDFRKALSQYVEKVLSSNKVDPDTGLLIPPFPPQRPTSLEDVKARIQWAGRNRRVVIVHYVDVHGVPHAHRDMEGYSYRYRAKQDRHVPLFYGWCRLHNEIHAMKLQGMTDVQFKDEAYTPRNGWPVEF